mgnify:CR=1 FL=1
MERLNIIPAPVKRRQDRECGVNSQLLDSEVEMTDENKNVNKDYEDSRETYYDLIERGRESLELMIEVARESEHPRAFEVLSGMIKNISDVNDKLMDLNKKNKEIKQEPKQLENQGTTNNNVFIGSTTDLQRILRDEEKVIDVTGSEE